MRKCAVCHYGEIALKGKNRKYFERKLVSNIREIVEGSKVLSPRGRIVVFSDSENLEEKISKIPGIDYFFLPTVISSSDKEIREKAVFLIKEKKFNTFRVTVKRSDKSFPISSMELSSIVGGEIVKETGKKVNLSSPDITCFIEINEKETYIYFDKIKGLGGLPVGSSGKAVSLISGGIDSPVASFLMMKRGLKNVFVHFHAYPSTSKESISKVEKLVKTLSAYQGESVLYLVPFDEVQKEIMLNTKDKLRVLLYRRFMMRIVEKVGKKEGAKAIVTGESLGQVASQTIENIFITGSVVTLPVFRPLIGYNKEEIVTEAKKIDTYSTSILPEEDCCVRFLPKNPETVGKIREIEEEEKALKESKIVEGTLAKIEKKIIF